MACKQKVNKGGTFIFHFEPGPLTMHRGEMLLFEGETTGEKFFYLEPGIYEFSKFPKYIERYSNENSILPLLPELPKEDYNEFKKVHFNYSDKTSMASINVKTGEIIYNDSFLSLPFYMQAFIIYHEIGHLYYDAEPNADLYAVKQCVINCIPVSMALACNMSILKDSPGNNERIKQINDISNKLNIKLQ